MGTRLCRSLVAACACTLAASSASGQHCLPPSESESSPFRPALRAEGAHYESGTESGYYEALAVTATLSFERFRARANVPFYRLMTPVSVQGGPGDFDAKLELAVLEDGHWSLGPGFAASFPTGNAEKRIGMGHVMLGPSAWFVWNAPQFFASAELGFVSAIEEEADDATSAPEAHEHHHGAGAASESASHHAAGGSIPNPMNPEEVWLGVNVSYDVLPMLSLRVGGTGAVPTSDEGETRATLRAGVAFPVARFETGVGFEIDVLGVTRREVASVTLGFLLP